jgi:hypothetical protein
MVIYFYDQFVCYWKWNTPTRELSTSCAAEVVQEDIHKNLDENQLYTTSKSILTPKIPSVFLTNFCSF